MGVPDETRNMILKGDRIGRVGQTNVAPGKSLFLL